MIELNHEERELLRQLIDQYKTTLEALPEDSLEEYREDLNLCLRLERKLDDGTDLAQPAWSKWED